MKRSKIFICLLLTLLLAVCGFAVGCADDGGEKGTGGDAVITVNGEVATGGKMGKVVNVPAATAVDGDGSDITSSVQVNVTGFDEDGEERAWPIFNKPAAEAQSFKPTKYADWTIVYSVTGKNGNLVTKSFDFKADPDETVPVLTVSKTDDITKAAGETILLPAATAVDDGESIAKDIEVRLYRGTTGNDLVNTYKTEGEDYAIALTHGTYRAVYGVSDGAGNKATETTVNITVSKVPYKTELLKKSNTVTAVNASWTGNTLNTGVNAESTDKNQSCATISTDKVGLDDVVGVTLQIDKLAAEGGEQMYHMGYYASKDNDSMVPSGFESIWPDAFFVRFGGTYTGIYSTKKNDNVAKQSAGYGLLDGDTHKLYMQVTTTGDSATADDASIVFKMWIDVAPDDTANHIAYSTATASTANFLQITVKRGAEDNNHGSAEENLDPADFDRYYDNAEGWLYFGSICSLAEGAVAAPDAMHVKSVKLYAADSDDFECNIPKLTIDTSSISKRQEKDDTLALPTAAWDSNAVSHKVTLEVPNGNPVDLTDETKYTFSQLGAHRLVWSALNVDDIEVTRVVDFTVYEDLSAFGLPYPEIADPVASSSLPLTGLISASAGSYAIHDGILNGSGSGKIIAVEMQLNGVETIDTGMYGLQVAGKSALSSWMAGSGLVIMKKERNILVCLNGKEEVCALGIARNAVLGKFIEKQEDGTLSDRFYLAYRLNYVKKGDLLGAVEIEVWIGRALTSMTKLEFSPIAGAFDLATSTAIVGEDASVLTLTAEMMDDKDMTEFAYGQGAVRGYYPQNGGSTFDILSAQVLDELPTQVAEPDLNLDLTRVEALAIIGDTVTFPAPVWTNTKSDTEILRVTLPNGTKQTVTGNSFEFEAKGDYVFEWYAENTVGVWYSRTYTISVYDDLGEAYIAATSGSMQNAASGNPNVKILNNSAVGKYVTMKLSLTEANEWGTFGVQILGSAPTTTQNKGGITLAFFDNSNRFVAISKDGALDGTFAYSSVKQYCVENSNTTDSAKKDISFYITYHITYNYDADVFAGVSFEVWAGSDLANMNKLAWNNWANKTSDLSDNTKPTYTLNDLSGVCGLDASDWSVGATYLTFKGNVSGNANFADVIVSDERPVPPVITVDTTALASGAYIVGTDSAVATLPTVSWESGTTNTITVTKPDGTTETLALNATTYTFAAAGDYTITYTSVSALGAPISKSVNVTVYATQTEYEQFLFVKNKSGSMQNAGSGNPNVQILKDSAVGKYVTMKLSLTGANEWGTFGVQVLGSTPTTTQNSGGITLAFFDKSARYIAISKDGTLGGTFAYSSVKQYCVETENASDSSKTDISFYVTYRITYNYDDEAVTGVSFEVWAGSDLFGMNKLSWNNWGDKTSDLSDKTKPTYTVEDLVGKCGLTAADYSVGSTWLTYKGTTSGTADFAEAQVTDKFPLPVVDVPTGGEVTVINESGSKTVGSSANVEVLSNSGDGKYVSVKLTVSGYDNIANVRAGLQILGSEAAASTMADHKGLFIAMNTGYLMISADKEYGTKNYGAVGIYWTKTISALGSEETNDGVKTLTLYLTYCVSYVADDSGNLAGVRVEVWAGAEPNALTKLNFTSLATIDGAEDAVLGGEDGTTTPTLPLEFMLANGYTEAQWGQGKVYACFASADTDTATLAFSDVSVSDTAPTEA